MKRTFFFTACLILTSGFVFSQGKDNSLKGTPFKERIVTGGGLGLGFSSVQDFISVSPVVGYSVTKKIIAGTGITYRYTNYKINPSLKLTDWAINPFGRYMIYNGFFIQTEYEYLNYELPKFNSRETVRENFNSVMAGGGLIQPVGRNLAFYIMALYNFSYTDPRPGQYSPYTSPLVLRAGINIGGFLGI